MRMTRGRSVLAAAAVVLAASAGAASAQAPAPAPGELPAVTITGDRGRVEAALISGCTSTPTGSTCRDGTVVGSPALHVSRGVPLLVHVDRAAAPTEMTFHDTAGQATASAGPDPTFAPLPPGTAQFTPPAGTPTGGYASVATSWDAPGWRGQVSYAVRLLFTGELAASRVRSLDLLRRHRRTRPPGLRVRVSDPGTITVRWRSAARSGRRVVRTAKEVATIALLGLPGRPRRDVRVTVSLNPADAGLARSTATRVFRPRG